MQETRKSEITGEVYVGEISGYFNEHKNVTQMYIGEALVQEISGELNNEDLDEYFNEYYPKYEDIFAPSDICLENISQF